MNKAERDANFENWKAKADQVLIDNDRAMRPIYERSGLKKTFVGKGRSDRPQVGQK